MNITEVQVRLIKPKDGLIAIASCVYNNDFYLGSIGVYNMQDGEIRLTFPNKELKNGQMIDIYHPISDVGYNTIKEAVEEELNELM